MKRVSRGPWWGMPLLVAAVMGCGAPQVQGNGHLIQQERILPEFTSLSVDNGIETVVVVDPSQPQTVRLVGDDNLLDLLRTEALVPGSLAVYFPPMEVGGWSSRNPLRVEVTVAELQQLAHAGGGLMDVSGHVGTPQLFDLSVKGGGITKVRGVDTGFFSLDVSGGADVAVEGRASLMTSRMSEGGVLRARELSVEEATLTSRDGGSMELRVSKSLRVTASDGGAVRIIGRPTVLQEELSGGSTLSFE